MSSDSDHKVQNRKRKVTEDKASLQLVLEPPSVPAKKPRLGASYPCLHPDNRNCVNGRVNGKTCRVVLDSGSTMTYLYWNEAKRLGLITGQETTIRRTVNLWLGRFTLDTYVCIVLFSHLISTYYLYLIFG